MNDERGQHGPVEPPPGQRVTGQDRAADRDAHLDRGPRVGGEPDPLDQARAALLLGGLARDERRAGQPAAEHRDLGLELLPREVRLGTLDRGHVAGGLAGRVLAELLDRGRELGQRGGEPVQQDPVHVGQDEGIRVAGPAVEVMLDGFGGRGGAGEIGIADVPEGLTDRRGDGRGQAPGGEGQGEAGHVGQAGFGVEQALVQGGGVPAGRDRGRVIEPGVDEQRGLVQPQQLVLQGPVGPLPGSFAAGGPGADGLLVQVGDLGGHLAGPGRVGTLHAADGQAGPGPEQGEVHGHGDQGAEPDLGREPAEPAERHVVLDEEAEERAHEGEHAAVEAERPEPAAPGADGQHHGQRGQRGDPDVQGQSPGQRGQQRQGQEGQGDQLAARGRHHADPEAAGHSQHGAQHHGDDHERVVHGPERGGQFGGRAGRNRGLQRAGGPDEEPLGGDHDADRDHDLGRHPQPHQARVGAVQPVQGGPAATGGRSMLTGVGRGVPSLQD
jgi:hypothetical protein